MFNSNLQIFVKIDYRKNSKIQVDAQTFTESNRSKGTSKYDGFIDQQHLFCGKHHYRITLTKQLIVWSALRPIARNVFSAQHLNIVNLFGYNDMTTIAEFKITF